MAKHKNGMTRTQSKRAAEITANGGIIPVGAFNLAMSPEAVAAKMAHLRSGAAGTHATVRRGGATAGHTNRIGSRSSQRRMAVRDYA